MKLFKSFLIVGAGLLFIPSLTFATDSSTPNIVRGGIPPEQDFNLGTGEGKWALTFFPTSTVELDYVRFQTDRGFYSIQLFGSGIGTSTIYLGQGSSSISESNIVARSTSTLNFGVPGFCEGSGGDNICFNYASTTLNAYQYYTILTELYTPDNDGAVIAYPGTSGYSGFYWNGSSYVNFPSPTSSVSLDLHGNSFLGGDPILYFAFPTQSSTVPLFSPWLLVSENIDPTHYYRVNIQWYATSVGSSSIIEGTERQNLVFGLGSDFQENGISIPRTDWGFDLATTTTIHASAQIFDTQDPDNPSATLAVPILVAERDITFTLQTIPQSDGRFYIPEFTVDNPNITTVATTSRPVGAIESPTFSTVDDCSIYPWTDTYTGINIPFFSSSSPARVSCEVKSFVNNFVAETARFGAGSIETAVQKMRQVFPLNVYDNFALVLSEARSTSSVTSTLALGNGNPNIFGGNTFVIFSPEIGTDLESNANFAYRDTMSKIFYVMTGLIMLTQSWFVVRRLFSQ